MAAEQQTPKSIQFFVKLPNNKTVTLQLPSSPKSPITPQSILDQIKFPQSLTATLTLTLTLNGKLLSDPTTQIPPALLSLSTITATAQLRGGKGGFGSLLRGAATKAGQKKTSNFDACRDMSGRRLRHVNAEKRMEEWKAEEEERRLERVAEDYLKKMVKKGKGGQREESAEKYVEKYRVESAKCVEEVERSVRESVGEILGKRKLKGIECEGDAKKLKIW